MVRIAPVRLAYNPKTLWFDPVDLDLHKDDAVVVSTARGLEFGHMAEEVFEAKDCQIKKLKTPLKPVSRLASDEDISRAEELRRRSDEALPIFKEMVAEAHEEMRPVSVEFLHDGDKAIFYFEAEERVDFRELVRKLAARFHVRIDMRQIGVRDEARMIGGLGHCGQELCCKRLGGEFNPVSIRMAKEQDLSLNPQKISGVCGRLMCCLRYEFDAYKDFKSRAPKQNAQIDTPFGKGKVVDLDVPREVIAVRIDGEKPVKIPLADFDPPQEGTRPTSVGADAWQNATQKASLAIAGETTFLTSQFTGQDKLADPSSVRHVAPSEKSAAKSRKGNKSPEVKDVETNNAPSESRKPRRRRSTKVTADGTAQPAVVDEGAAKRKQRPAGDAGSGQAKKSAGRRPSQGAGRNGQNQSRNADSSQGGASSRGQQSKNTQGPAKAGPRPGQKSSGLRQQQGASSGSGQATPRAEGSEGGRRRRRSHRSGGAGTQSAQGGADNQGGVSSAGGSNET